MRPLLGFEPSTTFTRLLLVIFTLLSILLVVGATDPLPSQGRRAVLGICAFFSLIMTLESAYDLGRRLWMLAKAKQQRPQGGGTQHDWLNLERSAETDEGPLAVGGSREHNDL